MLLPGTFAEKNGNSYRKVLITGLSCDKQVKSAKTKKFYNFDIAKFSSLVWFTGKISNSLISVLKSSLVIQSIK